MGEPVASEPRLFVGQVPSDVREEDLWPLFTPFGTVRNLHLLKGSDGKPRGCAMVLFQRWSQAEAAAEALDGQLCLETGGQRKPLVVHFANPRRAPPGQPAEPGIAPRKLFVGQVPRDVTEETLRPLFEPYGDIEHINILRTHRGQSAGCAFVQFQKWSQAELAMEAHNGKTRLGNSEVPLVVKFADAKRKDAVANQMHGGWMGGAMGAPRHVDMYGNGLGNGLVGGQLGGLGGMGDYQHLGGMLTDNGLLNNMGLGIGNGGPYGMQDPNFLANGLLGGSLANSLGAGTLADLALTQGLASMPNAPQNLPGGLPGAGNLHGFGGMGGLGNGPDALTSGFGKLGLGGRNSSNRVFGQKIGSNDKHNEWKLFIGQVPLEATEQQLYDLFAPIGEILELYILRNSNGKSRGCAFVTYANKFLAQQAITQLNGKQVPPGKTLVVKFADRAIASRNAAVGSAGYQGNGNGHMAGNGNGNLYM
ncbi:probable CUGBP Elav-like family member 2 [Coccomyxa sp. Obi]|nr:probable CUGBP Elav-like family member 2 [Coccomyxa sp. Obi]